MGGELSRWLRGQKEVSVMMRAEKAGVEGAYQAPWHRDLLHQTEGRGEGVESHEVQHRWEMKA